MTASQIARQKRGREKGLKVQSESDRPWRILTVSAGRLVPQATRYRVQGCSPKASVGQVPVHISGRSTSPEQRQNLADKDELLLTALRCEFYMSTCVFTIRPSRAHERLGCSMYYLLPCTSTAGLGHLTNPQRDGFGTL